MNRHVIGIVASLLVPNFAFAQVPAASPHAIPPPPAPPVAPAAAPVTTPIVTTPVIASTPVKLSDRLQGPAKANYDAGKLLFGDGDYNGALLKFSAAFDLSKDPGLLWDMVACEKMLRHYAKAVTNIDRYLAEGGAVLTDQDRADAKSLRDTLAAFTAPITITVSEPDAEVLLDGDVVGHSPLKGPIVADIGERHFIVRKPGFTDFTTTLKVSMAVAIDAKLVKETHEARLDVRAPDGAAIKIDGNSVGVGTWGGVLPSGGHTLNVSAPRMRAYQTEITLLDNQPRTVDVALEPEAKGGVPAWVWIVGGVVVAGGAVAGGYALLHKSDTFAPTTAGTINPGTVQLSHF
jgi:hypothetical protein